MIHRPALRRVIVAVLVLGLAWLFAGTAGLVVGVAGLTLASLTTPRWVAAAALAALVVAALATVLQATPTEAYDAHFASRRPVAAQAARAAGILALVAIALSAVDERRHGATTSASGDRDTRRPGGAPSE
jgi:hypothetical protein